MPEYGLDESGVTSSLPRQLVALTTFSDLVSDALERIRLDAMAAGLSDDGVPLRDGGEGATAYAEAVSVYLSLAIDRMAMTGNNLVRWNSVGQKAQHCFGRQALPMIWDFAEANFLAATTGSVDAAVFYSSDPLRWMEPCTQGIAFQSDARRTQFRASATIVSADPPYYDNIGYADLSDFFYVWLRRSLRHLFPDLFATLTVPKTEELVATPYRHGSKEKAEAFFLEGMTEAMRRLAEQSHPGVPVTIYYAFKQSEKKGDAGADSSGWATFLGAVIESGFSVTGTWPLRTEMKTRQVAMGTNALASSIVLVCRKRPQGAPLATRREFVAALRTEIPDALSKLQRGNVAPVDLAQAAIGPGMSIFTRYSKVLDAQGQPVSVREALALINGTLDEALTDQEGDFDPDTRWALAWFEQSSFAEGEFGVADTLSRAKNTSVAGMVNSGIVRSGGGKVRLLRPSELRDDWDPTSDSQVTAWVAVHQIVTALETGGESAAADLLAKLGSYAETARELCYRLYTLSERKSRAAEALSYNALVQSWPEIARLARETSGDRQGVMLA